MSTRSTQSSLRIGATINAIGFVIQFACTFLLTPIVVRYLGKSGYGIWVLVNSFSGYYGLVNLGLSSALVRYIALYSAKKDTFAVNKVVTTGIVFFSITGVVVSFAAFCAIRPLTSFFEIAPAEADAFGSLVRMLGVATAFDFVGVVYTAILSSHERYLTVGVVNIVRTLLRFGTTFVLLRLGYGLYGLGITTLSMSLVLLVSNWRLSGQYHPEIVFRWADASFATLKQLLRYGGSTFLMNIVNLARTRIGHLILAKANGVAAVALFGIASSIVMQFYSMLSTTLGSLTARFVRLDANKRSDDMRVLFRKSLFVSSLLSFSFAVAIFLFGGRFVQMWVGKDFSGATNALYLLTAAYVLALCQSPGWNVMFGTGKHHFMAVTSCIEVVLTLTAGLLLAPQYGVTGVAAATGIGMVVTKVLVQPIYVARILEMPLGSYITPIMGPALVAAVVCAGARFSGLTSYWNNCSIILWLLSAVATLLVYWGICVGLAFRQPFFVNPLPRKFRLSAQPA